VFHGSDKSGVGLWRNDELLFQMRFEGVFFSVRPIVLSLALGTMYFTASSFMATNRAPLVRYGTIDSETLLTVNDEAS
jgi:hypothetical protein